MSDRHSRAAAASWTTAVDRMADHLERTAGQIRGFRDRPGPESTSALTAALLNAIPNAGLPDVIRAGADYDLIAAVNPDDSNPPRNRA